MEMVVEFESLFFVFGFIFIKDRYFFFFNKYIGGGGVGCVVCLCIFFL